MKWKGNKREYQRVWMQKWRQEHPEEALVQRRISMRKWEKKHPEEHNRRNREFRHKWKGIPESTFQKRVKQEFHAYSLDETHPDFFSDGKFIEVKRALPFRKASWTAVSKYFPSLYFFRVRECTKTPSLDEQIRKYPKPLLVIVFHALTGEELDRKEFEKGWVEVSGRGEEERGVEIARK